MEPTEAEEMRESEEDGCRYNSPPSPPPPPTSLITHAEGTLHLLLPAFPIRGHHSRFSTHFGQTLHLLSLLSPACPPSPLHLLPFWSSLFFSWQLRLHHFSAHVLLTHDRTWFHHGDVVKPELRSAHQRRTAQYSHIPNSRTYTFIYFPKYRRPIRSY